MGVTVSCRLLIADFCWLWLSTEVLRKRGPERVAKDLLVGFDPVSIYLAGLQRRFDGVATFCADILGGPLVGVKWSAQVG